jgi:hypothetical protein
LAKAIVLLYQPPGFSTDVDWHGASDRTHRLTSLDLQSEVLKIKRGVIPLFSSLVGWRKLEAGQTVSLKELLVAIPSVGAELTQFYGMAVRWIEVVPRKMSAEGSISSQFQFRLREPDFESAGTGRLTEAMSVLHGDPGYDLEDGEQTALLSRARWATADEETAERDHQQAAQRLVNLGGQRVVGPSAIRYAWRWAPDAPILPTLSAALMLSFVLSSLYRYRAGLLDRIESSEISLILETFEGESDAIVLPGLRHLLYGRPLFISRMAVV